MDYDKLSIMKAILCLIIVCAHWRQLINEPLQRGQLPLRNKLEFAHEQHKMLKLQNLQIKTSSKIPIVIL